MVHFERGRTGDFEREAAAVPGVERGTVGTGDSHSFNLPGTFRHAYWLLPESEIGLWGRSLPCPTSFLHPAGLRIELVRQEPSLGNMLISPCRNRK